MNGVPASPLVLGIDPGLRICGWGLVRAAQRPSYAACGVVKPKTTESLEKRLLHLHTAISQLIETYQPDEIAIEDPFVGAINPASALAIGQARAVAMLAAAQHDIEVSLYAPKEVKAAVGYGGGDKAQVGAMVKLLMGLDAVPQPADASDALAVAICHLSHRRLRQLEKAAR
jgi:crossover junction endodeoxyribonuclease RuvC